MSVLPPTVPPRNRVIDTTPVVVGIAGSAVAAAALVSLNAGPVRIGVLIGGVVASAAALIFASARTINQDRRASRRSAILDATSSDVLLIVSNDRIVQAGGATLRLLGCAPEALLGSDARIVLPFADPDDFERLILRGHTDRPKPVVAENVRLQLHDGRTPTIDLVVHQPVDASVDGTIVRLVDATDRYHLRERLSNVGALDPVSGLANRERTIELGSAALHRAKRTGEHLAVLAVHLDGLAAIAETFGAHVADEVVRVSSSRLATALRTEDIRGRHDVDVLVAVAGGMAQDIGRGYAVDVADRVTESLSSTIYFDGHTLQLHPWIGIAHRAKSSGNPQIEDLLNEALQGMEEVRRATTRWAALD